MAGVTRNHGKAALTAGAACAALVALAACSSSSSSSSSTAAASASATSAPPATTTPATTTPATTTTAAAVPQADCVIIKKVDSSAITTLTPLQSESKSKAAASMASYLTQLKADKAKLTSAKGKAVLSAWISDVEKSETETTAAATTTVLGGLTALGQACP